MFEGRFDDRVVVVTGAAQGIGAAVGLRAAAEGAHVVLGDRSPLVKEVADRVLDEGGTALAHRVRPGDLCRCRVARGSRPGRARTGRHLDQQRRRHHLDPPVRALRRGRHRAGDHIASLFPTLWCCRAVLPHMVERGSGTIVNVSSIATRSVNRVPYAAAKGGVNALTASLAFEAAPKGVRVVATAPGGTEAPARRVPRNTDELGERDAGLVRRDRRSDGVQHPPRPLRHARRAGRAHPLPRLRRGLLHHRQRAAGRRRRPGLRPYAPASPPIRAADRAAPHHEGPCSWTHCCAPSVASPAP